MAESAIPSRRRLGVVLVFVALAALAGGLTYVLPLGFSARDAVFVAAIVLAFLVVRLTLDDNSV